MTDLGMRPYAAGDPTPVGTVPVSVVVLTKDEEVNIERCLASVAWAAQVVVVDSGSTDRTVQLARRAGAEIIEQDWLGFASQREFALRSAVLRHDWVYFVDADEWISSELAQGVSEAVARAGYSAYRQRFRLVFSGAWIRHCGWYSGSWVVRLMDKGHATFSGAEFGERVTIDGRIGRLDNDIVDWDKKGLVSWLHKHIRYAELEADKQAAKLRSAQRLRRFHERRQEDSTPFGRAFLRDVVAPGVPAKPVALFLYMYVLRLGFLDGMAGLRFCFLHAWFRMTVSAIARERTQNLGSTFTRESG